ncbi:unnamed protein product [Porites lobata]|uniref:Phospholipase A2 n=1 Tax=Porites lobata TaxID=104759 RepID=A0ABN8PJ44_9CNID|nr:unnamed protein product [Porites lobata]
MTTLKTLKNSNQLADAILGIPQTRMSKRSVLQFGFMIACETKRSPLEYNGYGCYCGQGGKGTPVDEIDWCCYAHDMCHYKLQPKEACGRSYHIVELYLIPYLRKGCSGCVGSPWNSCVQKKLCECDAEAAKCFKKYDSKFNENYKNYLKSTCK